MTRRVFVSLACCCLLVGTFPLTASATDVPPRPLEGHSARLLAVGGNHNCALIVCWFGGEIVVLDPNESRADMKVRRERPSAGGCPTNPRARLTCPGTNTPGASGNLDRRLLPAQAPIGFLSL